MQKRNPESGYALLLVFAMAAIIAINLYMAVPRAAFEAQRDKEQLLMDRGHEYQRAIALYVRKFNRFPGSLDDLENTNNQRFLRRRYADPMTGKQDWRILHAGPGGVITDSVVNKKPADAATPTSDFVKLLGPMIGSETTGNGEAVNLATRARPSDLPGGATSDPNNPTVAAPPPDSFNNAPPGSTLQNPNQIPGAPVVNGQGAGLGGPLPTGIAVQQGANPNAPNTPGLPAGAGPPGSAASLINQILTTPRPGGLPGLGGAQPPQPGAGTAVSGLTPAAAAPQQQIIGAGIAGVASTREQEGIKTYNERKKYNEWEFVYDVTKDPTKVPQMPAGMTGAAGATGAQNNAANTNNPSSNPVAAGQSITAGGTATGTATTPTQ